MTSETLIKRGWKEARTIGLFHVSKEDIDPSKLSANLIYHYNIPYVQQYGDAELCLPETVESNKQVVHGGELLVSKLNPYKETIVLTKIRETLQICSTEFVVLKPKNNIDLKFSYYLYKSEKVRSEICSKVNSATRSHQRANPEDISKIWILLPPPQEQKAIVDSLDKETSRIDALISKKERQIELLQEKRQAIITRAVTKGLDPNAKVRDSGIPWLGKLAESWGVVPLSLVSRIVNGTTPSRADPSYWDEGTIPWVSSGEVNQGVVTQATANVTKQALAETSLRIIKKGAVLIGLIGEGKTRGMSALLAIDACINQNVAAIEPKPSLNSRYLWYVLQHSYRSIREYGRGGQQDALNCELLGSFRIPFPSIREQEAIVSHIERSTKDVSMITDQLRKSIDLLHEYRSSLITAAVSGQIDVSKISNGAKAHAPL